MFWVIIFFIAAVGGWSAGFTRSMENYKWEEYFKSLEFDEKEYRKSLKEEEKDSYREMYF